MDNGNFVLSIETEEFEKEFSAQLVPGSETASVANATIGLELIFSFYAQQHTKAKKMAIPTNTNFATVASAIRAGWTVFMVDCNPVDLNTDYKSFIAATEAEPNISAVCLVHIGGVLSKNLNLILNYCKVNNILVFEDCAHAIGCEYDNKHAGTFGEAGAFSFFPTKPLGATEGGIVVSKNKALIDYVKSMRNQGKRDAKFGNLHEDFGGSYRMNEFSAIMCNVLLPIIQNQFSERFKIAAEIDGVVKNNFSTNFPHHMSKWSVYKLILVAGNTDEFQEISSKLKEKNINISGAVYNRPIHMQPVFKGRIKQNVSLKCSEKVCPLQLALPVPALRDEEYLNNLSEIFV